MTTMGFGGALLAMWQGHQVGRKAWNEPGATVIPAIAMWHMGTERTPTIIRFVLGSDTFREWVPTNADLLANDWIKHD
jgi:hypothetical protein